MTKQRQAELISAACKAAGLDDHIRWIETQKQADTWAEKIAMRFKDKDSFPVKNSFMYCDTLDMCFFYDPQGVPRMTYAGFASAESPDITEGKLIEAFHKAIQVLNAMKEMAKEVKDPAKEETACLK